MFYHNNNISRFDSWCCNSMLVRLFYCFTMPNNLKGQWGSEQFLIENWVLNQHFQFLFRMEIVGETLYLYSGTVRWPQGVPLRPLTSELFTIFFFFSGMEIVGETLHLYSGTVRWQQRVPSRPWTPPISIHALLTIFFFLGMEIVGETLHLYSGTVKWPQGVPSRPLTYELFTIFSFQAWR